MIALIVALGGTGYAAIKLPRNSVGSAQLKSSAVKTPDVATGAITSQKVKDGTLLPADFAGGLPAGAAGPAGPAGPKGDQGAQGEQGQQGTPGTPGASPYTSSGLISISALGGAGATAVLLNVGPFTYTMNCLDQGGGSFRVEIRLQSTSAGSILAQENGSLALTPSPQMVWFEFGTAAEARSLHHQTVTPQNGGHDAIAFLGHHLFGADCSARVDVR